MPRLSGDRQSDPGVREEHCHRVEDQPDRGSDDAAVDADELEVGAEQELEAPRGLPSVPTGDGVRDEPGDLAVEPIGDEGGGLGKALVSSGAELLVGRESVPYALEDGPEAGLPLRGSRLGS